MRRGISLTELLIVLAIIGILVAIGAGGVRALLDRGRLSEATNVIEGQIQEARRLAKRLDQDVTFTLAAASGIWEIDVNGRTSTLPAGVSIVPIGGATLVFDAPFGTYAGGDVAMEVAVGSASRDIVVTGVLARVVRP